MSKQSLHRGDVVLVPFPFTDQSDQKVRPAVIVSPDPQGEDLLLAFITSVMPPELSPTDYILLPSHPEFPATGLKAMSIFRAAKMTTIHRRLVLRRLGRIGPHIQAELNRCLRMAVGL